MCSPMARELVAAGEDWPPRSDKTGYRGMDKGHYNEIEMFRRAVLSNGPSPVGAVDGARAFVMGLTAAEAMKTGKIMEIDQSLYML